VRSGPHQPLAPEQRDKPGASSYQPGNPGKQGGDVSGAGDKPVETNMTERLRHVEDSSRRSPPASHASHDYAVLAPLRDRLEWVSSKS